MGGSCSKCKGDSPRTLGNMQLMFSPQNKNLFRSADLRPIINEQPIQNNPYDREFQQFMRKLFPTLSEEIQHQNQFMEYLRGLYQIQKENALTQFSEQLTILIKSLLINRSILKEGSEQQWQVIQQLFTNNLDAIVVLSNQLKPQIEITESLSELNPPTNAQTPINNSSYNLAFGQFITKLFCDSHELIITQVTFVNKLDKIHRLQYSEQYLLFLEQLSDLIKNLTEGNKPFNDLNQNECQVISDLIESDPKHIQNLIQVFKEYESEIIHLEQSSSIIDQPISRQGLDIFIQTLFSVEIDIIHNQLPLMRFVEELFKLLQDKQYVRFVKQFELLISSLTIDKNLFATFQQFEWIQITTILQDQPNYIDQLIEALSVYKQQIIKQQRSKNYAREQII